MLAGLRAYYGNAREVGPGDRGHGEGCRNVSAEPLPDNNSYRAAIGKLLYLAMTTRPVTGYDNTTIGIEI